MTGAVIAGASKRVSRLASGTGPLMAGEAIVAGAVGCGLFCWVTALAAASTVGPEAAGPRAVAPGGRPGLRGMASAWLIAGMSTRSGSMPSMGPIRAMTLPAAGATTQPAVA